jgi:hypothetical protein
MSKKPMEVLPEDLFPPEVTTPEERFEHLGRKLFAVEGPSREKEASGKDHATMKESSAHEAN